MSKPWHMASVRQRQPVRKYKPCAPVGDRDKNCVSGVLAGKYEVLQFGELRNVSFAGPEHEWRNVEPEACSDCGYHVCSCPPRLTEFGKAFASCPPKREPQGPGYWCSKCRRGHGDCVFVGIGMRSCVDVNDPTPQSPFTYKHGATCTCIDCCERRKS